MYIKNITANFVTLLAILISSNQTQAQNTEQIAVISTSLSKGARIRFIEKNALNPEKAGYYQIIVKSSNFTKKGLCWDSDEQRRQIIGNNKLRPIWSFALKEKNDWGAGVNIVYDDRTPRWDDPSFASNLSAKFFAVQIDGSSPNECQVKDINFVTIKSPLIPLNNQTNPTTSIRFFTWYNKKEERSRIESLIKGGASIAGFFGLPVGLITPFLTPASGEVSRVLDKERTSDYRTTLDPLDKNLIKTVGYLGLREPADPATDDDLPVSVELKPVASVFYPRAESFDEIDMSKSTIPDIMNFTFPSSKDATQTEYLTSTIQSKTASFAAMINEKDDIAVSAVCDLLYLDLINKMKFSTTDAAIIVYTIARQRVATGTTKHIRDIQCIADKANILKKNAKIELVAEKTFLPIGPAEVNDRMRGIAQFRSIGLNDLTQANWSIFSFPLSIYDGSGRFNFDSQKKLYTVENRTELKNFFDANISNIGCLAFFNGSQFDFIGGLGGPDDAHGVRKAAVLTKLANGDVQFLQIRFDGNPSAQKIDGLAFTNSDPSAKAIMQSNVDCNLPGAGNQWVRDFLQTAAP